MILRNPHVESTAAIPEVLSSEDSTLLTNQQRSAVGVAANIVWADGQIGDLEALDSMDVKTLVEHAVLDDAVAFFRSHGASAQGVPGGLDVTLCVVSDLCSLDDMLSSLPLSIR